MPSATQGFTRDELVTHIQNYIGNTSTNFQTWFQDTIWLAQYRFCKAHDWKWLDRQDLRLNLTSGTRYYNLDSASVGYYIRSEDIRRIWSEQSNQYVQPTTLDEIRRLDSNNSDGDGTSPIMYWAPAGGDNEIVVYPRAFVDTFVRVDGRITPTPVLTGGAYLTIPIYAQDTFIEYLKALALDRENDQRAPAQKSAAFALIKNDIQDDRANLGGNDNPRMRSLQETQSGTVGDAQQLYNFLFFYDQSAS